MFGSPSRSAIAKLWLPTDRVSACLVVMSSRSGCWSNGETDEIKTKICKFALNLGGTPHCGK
jgi:hypothetical protein